MTTNPYFKFALNGGNEILKRATPTTMGLRFPADSKNGFESKYEYKLYDGAAGIGMVLLDLFRATKNQHYARMVEEISYGLVTSTPESPPLFGGLYSGFAGVGFFHLACRWQKYPPRWPGTTMPADCSFRSCRLSNICFLI